MRQPITDTPTVLAAITQGTSYTLQNQSNQVLYVETAEDAPTDSGGAFNLAPALMENSAGIFKANSGQSIYVWADKAGGAVVYDEVP